MRLRTTLAVFGLVAAMGMFTGCKSWCQERYPCAEDCCEDGGGTEAGSPWLKPGVVRAERDNVLVGYYTTVEGDPATQLWLLRWDVDLDIPMNINGELNLIYLNADTLTHPELCEKYGDELIHKPHPDPATWKYPSMWESWGSHMEVGTCVPPLPPPPQE